MRLLPSSIQPTRRALFALQSNTSLLYCHPSSNINASFLHAYKELWTIQGPCQSCRRKDGHMLLHRDVCINGSVGELGVCLLEVFPTKLKI